MLGLSLVILSIGLAYKLSRSDRSFNSYENISANKHIKVECDDNGLNNRCVIDIKTDEGTKHFVQYIDSFNNDNFTFSKWLEKNNYK